MVLPRKKRRGRAIKIVKLDKTSSLNSYFICDYCGRREKDKKNLIKHIKKCLISRTCRWCNVVLKNRANLFTHSQTHGEEACPDPQQKQWFSCAVCPKYYSLHKSLRYHIRQEHYNMKAKIIIREKKQINEEWYEHVLNTDTLISIKKCGPNKYLMKKAIYADPRKILESKDIVDVSRQYATRITDRVWCNECQRTYSKLGFRKHVSETHMKIRKHHCNNCNRGYKRLYQYLQHNCVRKPRNGPKKPQLKDSVVIQD